MKFITTDLLFNTGGNVGTAAWVFATSILEIETVAVIGMDLGYYKDTPLKMTQTYYELEKLEKDENIEDYFEILNSLKLKKFIILIQHILLVSQNLLALLEENNHKILNCTGGGTLYGKNVILKNIENFLQ